MIDPIVHECDPEKALLAEIIEQGKKDLVLEDDRLALRAAQYFFTHPAKNDDNDVRTFTGLCAVIQIDSDHAAEAIFNKLLPDQQKRICSLLKARGYKVRSKRTLVVS